MERKRFSSPREEALEIAYQTRKDILEGKRDAVSVLRACLVIATVLNKNDAKKWIMQELSGYPKGSEIPEYRTVLCEYRKEGVIQKEFTKMSVFYEVHVLSDYLKKGDTIWIVEENREVLLPPTRIDRILAKMIDACLFFLNDIIAELQYGGTVEYLMEEIRKNTDETLAKLDRKLTDEAQSLFLNLTSTNPADWNKVGHSCRKILKLLADNVFPPRDEPYRMKDNRTFEVDDPHFINRLCAFLDQKVAHEERKFLIAEIQYLESYLHQIVEYAQMGEHKPFIEKYHANMIAIHTYLIVSEILKHK